MWILFEVNDMIKKIRIIGLMVLVMIVLIACSYPPAYEWKISSQTNTQWISEDETITFSVNDSRVITGVMEVDSKVVEIYIATEPQAGAGMHIYPINVIEFDSRSTEDRYEYWVCSYESEKEFVATVKKTTYYNVGQEIKFTRVDDIKQNSTP